MHRRAACVRDESAASPPPLFPLPSYRRLRAVNIGLYRRHAIRCASLFEASGDVTTQPSSSGMLACVRAAWHALHKLYARGLLLGRCRASLDTIRKIDKDSATTRRRQQRHLIFRDSDIIAPHD